MAQLESSKEFQSEMSRISEWIESEEISFDKYDESIVRYLVDSIRVTEDMQLVIKLKGGTTVTEAIFLNTERSPV